MKHFAQLFATLDHTNSTLKKVAALEAYFARVPDEDKLQTIALLSGRRPKRTVTTRQLREWAAEVSGIPDWLFEESYSVVGDLAESIALVLPEPTSRSDRTLGAWVRMITELRDVDDEAKRSAVIDAWMALDWVERFVFNKLITGGFRIGVSQKLMSRALGAHTGLDEDAIACRLMGDWTPFAVTYDQLIHAEDASVDAGKPYPFYLAYPLEGEPEALGDLDEWQVERKWDGIRGQIIVRQGKLFVWSRGEELMTDRFPEYDLLARFLPNGTVIDGEILPWKDDEPLPFAKLQTRIGRKNVTKKVLEDAPVILMAYDLLEVAGEDIRARPLSERRKLLEELVAGVTGSPPLRLSPILDAADWAAMRAERARSREVRSEGLMLKRRDSPYRTGRKKGDWWKWKIDPLTVDAVMIYAMRGHGRRANLYTDYTFAVWDGDELVPFAKAYSGLTDAEIRKIDHWVKRNTVEKFGPVRSVKPEIVMELAFEGIQESSRHKSGIALRFPRIARWRHDKPPHEANTLADLKAMLNEHSPEESDPDYPRLLL